MLPPHVNDVGVSSSLKSSSHVCVPHNCITCKNICLGHIGDLFEYQFVFDEDTPDVGIEATHPNVREEGHAKVWNPSVLVRIYIFLLRHMQFQVNLYNRVILIFNPIALYMYVIVIQV